MIDKEKILSDKLNENTFSMRVDADRAFLVTLSDLHVGMGERNYIKSIVDFILSVPNMYVVLGGDAVNNTTKTSKGTVVEEYATGQEQLNMLVEYMKPLVEEKRIVAVCGGGNHERRTYNDCFISIPEMIATLLGIADFYVPDMAIGYINVRDNCYMYGVIHKHRKTKNYYEHLNCDVLVMEHTHELNFTEKLVLEHNKFAKKTSVKTIYELDNGSALALPSYAKFSGYRPLPIGCYITELSGKKRDITIWKDSDLFKAIENGYNVG
jgi:predicted phosphodiesterase